MSIERLQKFKGFSPDLVDEDIVSFVGTSNYMLKFCYFVFQLIEYLLYSLYADSSISVQPSSEC